MLDIVKSDVSALGNRLATGDSKSDVLQVLVRRREFGEDQVGVESLVRDVRESRDRQLLVVNGVSHNAENTRLGKACSGAGVGAEAEPEAVEVERLDARAGDGLSVGVESQLAELEEIEGAGGTCVLRLRVRDYACEAFDGALVKDVSKVRSLLEISDTYEDDDAAPAEAIVLSDREQLRSCDVCGEVVELREVSHVRRGVSLSVDGLRC